MTRTWRGGGPSTRVPCLFSRAPELLHSLKLMVDVLSRRIGVAAAGQIRVTRLLGAWLFGFGARLLGRLSGLLRGRARCVGGRLVALLHCVRVGGGLCVRGRRGDRSLGRCRRSRL